MKLTENFKFRFVDSELTQQEIKKLTQKEWQQLYKYQRNRYKRIIDASSRFVNGLMKWTALSILVVMALAGITYLIK
jgi:hypothetical protein